MKVIAVSGSHRMLSGFTRVEPNSHLEQSTGGSVVPAAKHLQLAPGPPGFSFAIPQGALACESHTPVFLLKTVLPGQLRS